MRTPGEQQPSGGGGADSGSEGVGRVLSGRYRVTGLLGRGGMGVVWRAVDEVLGREVAVKELRTYTDARTGELDELRARMQREARAAARVRHSGVIAVHDIAQHEGRPVIVMELVEGPSLGDVLAERGSVEPREAAAIGGKVMDALAAAHRAGVLHRDVKPANVLLERGTGRVVLTDFGIAAMEDPDGSPGTDLTGSGELVGSLDYLAPERARGDAPCAASDVWALGATLYAAVEGAAPFRRTSTWSTLTAIVVDPLPEPRRAGPLAPVLAELMDKDPAARADATRAAALLDAVAAGNAPPPPPPSSGTLRLGRAVGAGTPGGRGPGTDAPDGAGPDQYASADTDRHTVRTRGEVRRGRRRAAIASVAAAVVLAAAGAAYAVLAQEPGDTRAARDSGADAGAQDRGGKKDSGRRSASGTPSPDGKGSRAPGPGASPGESARGEDRSGSGGEGEPAACRPGGGGKYDCSVWRTATSYNAAHEPVGRLKSGTNYFFCQTKLSHRETSGRWTNVWWARTDDDSGNTGVLVSVVYVRGGDNDRPVPGLPVC